MARRFWTPDEVQLLREIYPDTPTSEVSARLDRKAADVYAKAQDLGVRKSKEVGGKGSGFIKSESLQQPAQPRRIGGY